jgi:hypothetical protein
VAGHPHPQTSSPAEPLARPLRPPAPQEPPAGSLRPLSPQETPAGSLRPLLLALIFQSLKKGLLLVSGG